MMVFWQVLNKLFKFTVGRMSHLAYFQKKKNNKKYIIMCTLMMPESL